MKRSDISSALQEMAEAVGVPMGGVRQKWYVEPRAQWPDKAIVQALAMAKLECRFFPSFAELLELSGLKPESTEEEAERIWYELRSWKSDLMTMPIGPETKKVVRAMGGRGAHAGAFGLWDANQEAAKRKEFIGRYRSLQSSAALVSLDLPQTTHNTAQAILNKATNG